MPEEQAVKVFISWSGSLARDVAVALREWLPLLFDRVAPWASDTDIAAGQRGLAQIEAELSHTRFGIVVVTSSNQHAPWLNFEAGALSKVIPGDVEHRVVPLLVDLTGPTQLTGPLAQFQAKAADREGMLSLLRSLAAVAGIEARVVETRFEAYWPHLEAKVEAAKEVAAQGQPRQPRRDQADVLDEILLHLRALRFENEGGGPPSRLHRDKDSTKAYVTQLAAEYDLDVYRFAQPHEDRLAVQVAPKGAFSEQAVKDFERAVRQRMPDLVASVDYVPF